jgi:hypothetical protein
VFQHSRVIRVLYNKIRRTYSLCYHSSLDILKEGSMASKRREQAKAVSDALQQENILVGKHVTPDAMKAVEDGVY